jgi:hypothetical protein
MNRPPFILSENLFYPELKQNLHAIATAEHYIMEIIQAQVDCAVQKVVEKNLQQKCIPFAIKSLSQTMQLSSNI